MSFQTSANQVPAAAAVGLPASGPNPQGARDQYEYGSLSTLTRQGRYKSFATGFSSRPVVVLTPLRSTVGTATPILVGTPNTGSFQARLVLTGAGAAAGTVQAYFSAFGPR